ncbi:MAG: hypothetical protein FWE46_00385 [Coriobacteriia bacterium]|nr:hypothetical protein [Coriobacteriia bacterium]MCL2536764.1 hypothetical protein [Coriobacteriia bacterium]
MKQYKLRSFGNKWTIQRAEGLLSLDDELLYIGPTNFTAASLEDPSKRTSLPGVIVITDSQVLFAGSRTNKVVMDFLLDDVWAIGGHGNGIVGGNISFQTPDQRVDFLVSYDRHVVEQVKGVLMRAAAARQRPLIQQVADGREVVSDEASVVVCGSCGASNIVKTDTLGICAYCRQPLAG